MTANTKMICPNCGAEMNHHCDKVLYASEAHDELEVDQALGGFIEEFHTCPRCGGASNRRA
jgi:ribosomal protein S27AE